MSAVVVNFLGIGQEVGEDTKSSLNKPPLASLETISSEFVCEYRILGLEKANYSTLPVNTKSQLSWLCIVTAMCTMHWLA
jgi:hypothetical protein